MCTSKISFHLYTVVSDILSPTRHQLWQLKWNVSFPVWLEIWRNVTWPWHWFNSHPSGCIGPHSNAILICFGVAISTSSQVIPILNKSLLTVLLQFVPGRHGPLLNPGTSQCNACWGMRWWSIRITCPSQRSLSFTEYVIHLLGSYFFLCKYSYVLTHLQNKIIYSKFTCTDKLTAGLEGNMYCAGKNGREKRL